MRAPEEPAVRALAIHSWDGGHDAQPPPASLLDPLFTPLATEHPENLSLYPSIWFAHTLENGGRRPTNRRC